MNYLTSKELSEQWNISQRRIIRLAEDGRIEGAMRLGKIWMFPENTVKPADGRTHRTKKDADFFRYPAFEHKDPYSFDPPLSKEELQLKATTEAFHACQFKEADRLIGDLAEKTSNKYIKITALYTGCMVDIYLGNLSRFHSRYALLNLELQEDFPHALEMREFLYELNATLGVNDYYTFDFHVDPGYDYHKSFLPRLANLSAVYLSFPENKTSIAELRAHELNCIQLENSSNYSDLQALHIYLGTAYAFLGKSAEMTCHFTKALALTEKYNLYYNIATPYFLTRNLFKPAMSGFSQEFKAKLTRISDDTHTRCSQAMDKLSEISIYRLLPSKYYIFLFYAVHGYSNKEIASRLHVSEGTIGKRYGEIYAMAGVNTKKELMELYERSVTTSFTKNRH